jgi:uncharacterized protein YciW
MRRARRFLGLMAGSLTAPPIVPWKARAIPGWRGGLSSDEREVVAYHAALAAGQPLLAQSYLSAARKNDRSRRRAAIVRFVQLATGDPRQIRCADVRALERVGLTSEGIAELARLVATITYQSHLLGVIDEVGG